MTDAELRAEIANADPETVADLAAAGLRAQLDDSEDEDDSEPLETDFTIGDDDLVDDDGLIDDDDDDRDEPVAKRPVAAPAVKPAPPPLGLGKDGIWRMTYEQSRDSEWCFRTQKARSKAVAVLIVK
jgi:hypothetical protein